MLKRISTDLLDKINSTKEFRLFHKNDTLTQTGTKADILFHQIRVFRNST
nr:hypothetical protein [Leptospira alexanderi]